MSFNFLAGSSIDFNNHVFFNMLKSGNCYLGFARGEKTIPDSTPRIWGYNALINVEFNDYQSMINSPTTDEKYFDYNNTGNQIVHIVKVSDGDSIDSGSELFTSSTITTVYVGKHWLMLNGLPNDYYTVMSYSPTASFYILNYNKSDIHYAKVLKKNFINTPSYSTECILYDKTNSTTVLTGIQKISNILGEHYVVGLRTPESIDPISAVDSLFTSQSGSHLITNKNTLKDHTFNIKDLSGIVLVDNLKFVPPDNSPENIYSEVVSPQGELQNPSKYLTFTYQSGGTQYLKFIVGPKETNELAIWNEEHPYESFIPCSDASPPGLEVSYLKNPLIAHSIFDVKGMTKIKPDEIKFVKELHSASEKELFTNSSSGYRFTFESVELAGSGSHHMGTVKIQASVGQTVIQLENYHDFLIGDTFYAGNKLYTITNVDYTEDNSSITFNPGLDVVLNVGTIITSEPSTAAVKLNLATTLDLERALQYGFNSVSIEKTVPLTGADSPTEDTYRQLFICYSPSTSTGTLMTNDIYKAPIFTSDEIFNQNLWKYDLGVLLYIANKIPINRKLITSPSENFRIIL